MTDFLIIGTFTIANSVLWFWAGIRAERFRVERRKRTAQGQLDATESMFVANPETARH